MHRSPRGPAALPGGGPLDVVTCAASAGGVRALLELFAPLPRDFPAAIAVVQHLSHSRPSMIAEILDRRTALTVREARTGQWLRPGVIVTAPPDRHMAVHEGGRITLSNAPPIHFLRPAADVLFASAAAAFAERAIGVVLSGTGKDGATGVTAIRSAGGTVFVQDPRTAEFPGMPEAAIATGNVDFVLPLAEMPEALLTLLLSRSL